MSKDVTLFFSVTDTPSLCQRLRAAFRIFCDDGYDFFTVRFSFCSTSVSNDFIKKTVAVNKNQREKHHFHVKYIIVCHYKQLKRVSLRLLSKHGFIINLQVDDVSEICALTKTIKRINRFIPDSEISVKHPPASNSFDLIDGCPLPIRLESFNHNNDDLIPVFNKWIRSEYGAEILNFTGLLNLIMRGEHTNCEYNSCLGRILSVDASGLSYWCKLSKPETALCQIDSVKTLDELYSNGLFEDYLDAHLKKREFCMKSCSGYGMCQSGCPLHCDLKTVQNEQCTEQEYLDVMEHISAELGRILMLGDLSILNKCARAVVLRAFAFAPFSDILSNLETDIVKESSYTDIG